LYVERWWGREWVGLICHAFLIMGDELANADLEKGVATIRIGFHKILNKIVIF
jgi:hypothetical protein